MEAGRIRVLLVEDDEDDYVLLRDLLSAIERSSFELEWAGTYEAGREAIGSGRHEVCLLDYHLGEHDGLELLAEALENGCQVPMILLTGQEDYAIDTEAMRIGAADYLVKGRIDATLLERSIRYAIAQKRLQERIRENSRLVSVGSLAAGVAHEVSNPLAVVLGYSELLLMASGLPDSIMAYLEKVHSAAQRAAKIVKDLLSFARITDAEKRYLDLRSILDQALDMKSSDFKVNDIEVIDELPPDLPRTMVDEQQLIQVLLNIFNNAEQECLASQGRGQLVLRAVGSRNWIRISISDDGPGVPAEKLNRIFDPFFTTKDVGKGTGLGLSICYGIIRQHNGDLWAENNPEKGATFHIELPIVAATEVEEEEEREVTSLPAGPARSPTTAKHLLVVDDEPHIRELLAQSLELLRYTVDLAEGGEEAWRKLQSMPYDCILLDLKMPGMSGQQLYQLIELSDKELAGKVIFITGDTVNSDTSEFIAAVRNPVMNKPFKLDDLHRQVLQLVESVSDPR